MFRRVLQVIKKWVHSRTKTVKKEVNAMSILICEINGNEVPMAVGSMRAGTAINNRGTASFVVYEQAAVTIQEGMNVVISRSDTLSVIFSGKIESVRDVFSLSENLHTLHINAVGWERIADRRIIAEVYRNRTAGYIVADIVAKYFAADGITAGVIEDGDVIPAATFAYRPAADVLRSLSEANDFVWFIDHGKALHFQPRAFDTAPWQIDTVADPQGVNSAGVREVSKYRALEQYRNRQYLKYSEISAERTESFGGDGVSTTFNVSLPVAQAPSVAVDGVPQTVGISGIDTGKDFYWNKGSAAITADEPPISLNTEISILKSEIHETAVTTGITAAGGIAAIGSIDTGQINTMSIDTGIPSSAWNGTVAGIASIYGMTFISDGVLVIAGNTGSTRKIKAFRISGVAVLDAGYPELITTDRITMRHGSSNGEFIVATNIDTATTGRVHLYRYSAEYNSISLAASYNAPGSISSVPLGAYFSGDYIAYVDKDLIFYRLDQSSATLIEIHVANVGAGFGGTWVGDYFYFVAGTTIKTYHLDRDNSTVTYIRDTVVDGDIAAEAVAIRNYVIIQLAFGVSVYTSSNGELSHYDYFPMDESDIGYAISAASQNGSIALILRQTPSSYIVDLWYSEIRPAPADISVTYRGTYPNVLLSDDPSEQAGRAIIEGGTGIYAAYQNSADTEGEPAAIDIAQTILERYGRVPERFEFTCTREGLQAGQILPVNWPDMGIAEDYLIESVQATDTGGTVIWYRIKAISGRDVGNWQEFWRSLREADSYDFGAGDTLPVSRSARDVITGTWTDSAVTDVVAAQTQWDLATFDIDEWQ